MEKNIFDGAKFGDKFVTRDGRIFIFQKFNTTDVTVCWGICEDEYYYVYYSNGTTDYKLNRSLDIVSRYQEPINKKKLDEDEMDYIDSEEMSKYDYDFETNLLNFYL